MNSLTETEGGKALFRMIVLPFKLEHAGKFEEAIKAHGEANEVLKTFLEKIKSNIRKVHRIMFERQGEIHVERKAYLTRLAGNYANVVVPPSILGVDECLKVVDGMPRPISLDHRLLAENIYPKTGELRSSNPSDDIKHLLSSNVPSFSLTLDRTLPPIAYKISHSSELIGIGQRSHWMYVKDETNTHTHYAMQAIWTDDAPITAVLLRRSSEFLPGAGAIHVNIQTTKGGPIGLKMNTLHAPPVIETPDSTKRTKNWSPRRFKYGGRQFVWKSEDTSMFPKNTWETLYETSKVTPKVGSKTGEMEDVTVGPRLCWGEKNSGGWRTSHTLYLAAGLDQLFQEHLLASQLARFIRRAYPANKDTSGIEEAAGTGADILSLVTDLAG